MMYQLPHARTNDLVIQELPDELLIFNSKTNKVVCLNTSAAFVWKHCDGKTDFQQLIELFNRKLNIAINAEFITLALDELAKVELIEDYTPTLNNHISRRSALLNYAFPLAVLPVITSLIAPKAINAQSVACLIDPALTCATVADCNTSQPPLTGVCTDVSATSARACCQNQSVGYTCCLSGDTNCEYTCDNNCCASFSES